MKEFRDEDGFIVLRRKDKSRQLTPKKQRGTIGEHLLIKTVFGMPKSTDAHYRVSIKDTYSVDYQPKTWQHKAWDLISDGIMWDEYTDFRDVKGSKKLRHLKCAAVGMKVRCVGSGCKPVIDSLQEDDESPTGFYMLARNTYEFRELIERWYSMLFHYVDRYLDQAVAEGYGQITYISKVMLVYDDHSYDCWMGYPAKLADFLGLKFDNKGRVILRER